MTHSSSPHQHTVSLKPVTRAGIPFLKSVEDDPDVEPYIRPWTPQAHEAALTDKHLHCFIAQAEHIERDIGFVILRSNPTAAHTIEFVRLAIAERGAGYGRAAIRAVLEFASHKKLSSVWLEVFPNNERALAVYNKEGFVEVSRSHTEAGFGGEPGEVIRMETTIGRV